jgi:nucleoside-diphosphate-sugar epimerase
MNTLVLGGTGFLSSALVAECLAAGHSVTVLTRGSANRPAPPPGVTALTANRSDPDSLRAALSDRTFDLVIDSILFRPDDARAVIDIFQGRVGRYIFISTDFVYGGQPRRYPLDEDSPRQALSRYGVDKAACEDLFFAAWESEHFPATMLRPPHIMGAGGLLGTGSKEGRDPWLLWRLRNGQPILLLDGGVLLIQPVHKTEIARAALAISAAPVEAVGGKAYNIVGPDCVTTRRYYEMICEIISEGAALEVLPLPSAAYLAAWPDRAPFTQNRAYSTARLTRDTGYIPSISLRQALTEVITDLDAKGLPAGDPPSLSSTLVDAIQGSLTNIAALLKENA